MKTNILLLLAIALAACDREPTVSEQTPNLESHGTTIHYYYNDEGNLVVTIEPTPTPPMPPDPLEKMVVAMSATATPTSGDKLIMSEGGPQYVEVTPEMEAILKADPVLQFVERVNATSSKHPEWKFNYTSAHYYAFVDEAQNYALELLTKKGLITPTPTP